MSHSATASMSLKGQESDAIELGARSVKNELENKKTFTDGAGVGACDCSGSLSETIALAAAPKEIDFHGDEADDYSILGLDGAAVAFAAVKGLLIKNTHATGTLTLNDGDLTAWAACPFADGSVIQPGGSLMAVAPLGAGYAVAAGSRTLKLTGSVDAVSFEIVAAGVSE